MQKKIKSNFLIQLKYIHGSKFLFGANFFFALCFLPKIASILPYLLHFPSFFNSFHQSALWSNQILPKTPSAYSRDSRRIHLYNTKQCTNDKNNTKVSKIGKSTKTYKYYVILGEKKRIREIICHLGGGINVLWWKIYTPDTICKSILTILNMENLYIQYTKRLILDSILKCIVFKFEGWIFQIRVKGAGKFTEV